MQFERTCPCKIMSKQQFREKGRVLHCKTLSYLIIWVVAKIMVPFGLLSVIRHLACIYGPKRGP